MKVTAYFFSLLTVLIASLAQAQNNQQKGTFEVAMPLPIAMPLEGLVGSSTIKLNPQDSLYQLILSRRKVRTITKLQIQFNAAPDTLEYTELDHHGNKVMIYKTGGRQRFQMKYDSQNRILERIQLPTRIHSYQIVENFDPQQKRYEFFRQYGPAIRQPLMSAQNQQNGDTSIAITRLYIPASPQLPVVRTVCRVYRTHGDTSRLEVIGYDSAHHVLGYTVNVVTKKNGRQTGSSSVLFQRDLQALLDTSAQVRQWRSQGVADAEILVRRRHQIRGQLLFTKRWIYNDQRQLLREDQFNPEPLRTKAVTRTTANSSITLGPSTASSTYYTYNKKGQLIQQEIVFHHDMSDNTIPPLATKSVRIVKTYGPKGLLLTETTYQQTIEASRQILPSQVEYHYTYY